MLMKIILHIKLKSKYICVKGKNFRASNNLKSLKIHIQKKKTGKNPPNTCTFPCHIVTNIFLALHGWNLLH